MTDPTLTAPEAVARMLETLLKRTVKTLPTDWRKGRKCPDCGSDADRPKCMWDHGPSCVRHDPDAYEPPAWVVMPDPDCAASADMLKALAARVEELLAQRRWNIDEDGNLVRLCRGEHEKGERCEAHEELFVPLSRLEAEIAARTPGPATVKVKPLSWREIDPEHRYVGTGLGFTCEVRRLHKGGWEAIWPQGAKETITCSGAMLACRNAYFAMVRSYLEEEP